jgi:hypothetical protein
LGSLIRHYQHPICAALITVKQGDFPELRIKAHAGRVLVSFLQQKVAQLINELREKQETVTEVLVLVHGTLSALCHWLHLVESAQRYLSEQEANKIWDTSMVFLA